MPSFKQFLERHGEVGVQALLDQMARRMNRDIWSRPMPLETIWNDLMNEAAPERMAA